MFNTKPTNGDLIDTQFTGDTSSNEFTPPPVILSLKGRYPSPGFWNHDYLVDEARIVAVLRSTSSLHELQHPPDALLWI